MLQLFSSLLVLLFSLSGPAMEGDADFWRSSFAAKRAGTLTKIGEDAWQSSGGLKYVGLDGKGLNRIEHVLQHVDPAVPGKSRL